MVEVKQNENEEIHAISTSGHTVVFLEFSKDDRKCWVTTGAANLRGIKKANIDTKVG